MTQEIPGFDRDPELDALLTSNLSDLDDDTRINLQRYKARLLKARRDADLSLARPPWWGEASAPETLEQANFSGVDLDTAVEAAGAASEATDEEEPVEEEQDVSEPADEEPVAEEEEEEPAEPEPAPEDVEISDDDLVEVGFEIDPDLEELVDQDIHTIESEEKRAEVQLYKSRKMQARQKVRTQATGGGGSDGSDSSGAEGGPDRDGSSRKAPPPEDVSKYRGERKIADLVSERTSGREITRRGFLSNVAEGTALGWAGFVGMFALTSAATGRFFFPNVLENPPEEFVAGRVEDFPLGSVSERFLGQYRVWIVNLTDRLVSILAICTHLGCTPNWLESQRIFSCPCHGSGYRMNGVNFEGPAPRPMDRVGIRLTPEGTLVVNKAQVFASEGTPDWDHEDAYIPL